MRLRFEHPHLAVLPCQECQQFAHDLKTGKPQMYCGKKLPQHPKGPPCVTEPGSCPKGKPGESDLLPMNQRVLEHFRQCRATGVFPDDGIVRMHAAILEPMFARAENDRQSLQQANQLGRLLIRMRR